MLLAMATGTGKTKLAIAMLYRLLAAKRFRRVAFIVDRNALGTQAAGEFSTTRIVSAKTFADIFGLEPGRGRSELGIVRDSLLDCQGTKRVASYRAPDATAQPGNAAIKVKGCSSQKVGNPANLPASESGTHKRMIRMAEEGYGINIIHHQNLRLVQV